MMLVWVYTHVGLTFLLSSCTLGPRLTAMGPGQGLALSTFQVVLVPTLVGVAANELAPGLVRRVRPVLPLLGVALTTLLCASPVAQVADLLRCAMLPHCDSRLASLRERV